MYTIYRINLPACSLKFANIRHGVPDINCTRAYTLVHRGWRIRQVTMATRIYRGLRQHGLREKEEEKNRYSKDTGARCVLCAHVGLEQITKYNRDLSKVKLEAASYDLASQSCTAIITNNCVFLNMRHPRCRYRDNKTVPSLNKPD